jgi:hypothetical protein
MMPDQHLDADAAMLYATGSLDARERDAMDAHAMTCDACARTLADASQTVEAIELRRGATDQAPSALRAGLRRRGRTSSLWPGIAVAAVLVAALSLARAFMLTSAMHDRDVALTSIVHSHFNHAPFIATRAEAPSAKVLYAQTGQWLYVVVDAPTQALHVDEITEGGGVIDAGRIAASRTPQTFYSQPSQRIVRVELRDDAGAAVARAALVYRR